MKIQKLILVVIVVSSLTFCRSSFAQGALTPPGAPAPTMKSLDQIEARTPISSAPYVITIPGSYYLTTNLSAVSPGITISANNVTLDLNGFNLVGPGTGVGIQFGSVQTNVTIRNGVISAWNYGLFVNQGTSQNIVLEHLSVSSCGFYGLYLTSGALVQDCVCNGNKGTGLTVGGGLIANCEASYNGGTGMEATGCIVRNCRARNNAGSGFSINSGMISGCLAANNVQSGIYVPDPRNQVVGNTCIGNNTGSSALHAGIFVNGPNNLIEGNQVSGTNAGIAVAPGGLSVGYNVIIKNSVSGNGTNNYPLPGNQVLGPLVTELGTITNVNPWANFSY